MKSESKTKVQKSFDYQCKLASKCRHEKYQISCLSCPDLDNCNIQKLIQKAKSKM